METTIWGTALTRQQLWETTSRLRTLNEVPELPKENVIYSRIDRTRRMTISREKEIASNLAFLLATSDDSLKVMAVCLEEHSNGEGTTIRIASNTGDLLEVTNGFIILAKILEQAARRVNSKPEDMKALLQQVIILDLYRILSRLRSRHAKRTRKTAGKPPLIPQLNEVVHDKSVRPIYESADSNWKAVSDKARALQVLFIRLESASGLPGKAMEVQEALKEIVKEAHHFTVAVNLSTAIQSFSGNPSLKHYLPEAIGKLGRYYAASSELICAARDRKWRIFKNIRVEPFQVPMPVSLQTTSLKVHAEIQLLFFYELHPDRPRPRIICSSKSACYLCNLFFHLHGGFQVPRTHGRIYDKWILPDWVELPVERRRNLGMLLTLLKATLDKQIQMASRSKKRQFLHPNESVLLQPAHWTSSALSGNLTPLPLASRSTVRPQSSLIQEGNPSHALSLSMKSPLNSQKTPIETGHAANIDKENKPAPSAVDPADNSTQNIPPSDIVSLITIRRNELPYSQSITSTTPPLLLRLDKLSLSFDFVQVISGHFSVTVVEDDDVKLKRHQIFNVEDIPTTTELQLDCSNNSAELSFYLQSNQEGIICITFVWDTVAASRRS